MKRRAALLHYESRHDWNSHQRGGFITLMLWQGSKLSNKDIARLTGTTRRAAQYMMEALSGALPIVFDYEHGVWRWMEIDE
jgi:hypothetical protein